MFFPGSRYEKQDTYTATRRDGTQAKVVRLPLPPATPPALAGFHPRSEGERLDLVAARHLKDATAFWRLADANDAVVPDSLAAAPLIGIPLGGGT